MPDVDRSRLTELHRRRAGHLHRAATRAAASCSSEGTNLFGRVPMTWMNKWTGGFPLYLDHARGNRISDVDGHTYVDFALGDTGAMAGHSPRATVEAVARRMGDQGGITTMLPTRRRPVGGRRADPPVRDAAVELHAVGHRRQPLGGAPGPAGDRHARRSSSSATATTARSTRPSRSRAPTARRSPARATSLPRCRSTSPPAPRRGTTWRPSSASSPTATSPRSSPSRR